MGPIEAAKKKNDQLEDKMADMEFYLSEEELRASGIEKELQDK